MKLSTFALALAFAANTAAAGTIQNADFSAGLDGWTVENYAVADQGAAILTAGATSVYSSLSQTITLQAGDVFSGRAQFFGNDYLPYDDHALVKINDRVLFSSSIASVGDNGNSGLTQFQFTAASAGTYTFWAGVANVGDSFNASTLLITELAVESQVPEPASLALLGLGLLGVAAARRRKA